MINYNLYMSRFYRRLYRFCSRNRSGSAVLCKFSLLLCGIAIFREHISRITAQIRTRTIRRLIIRHGKRTTHSHKLTDFAPLINFHKSISVIQALVIHNLLS